MLPYLPFHLIFHPDPHKYFLLALASLRIPAPTSEKLKLEVEPFYRGLLNPRSCSTCLFQHKEVQFSPIKRVIQLVYASSSGHFVIS